MPRKVMTAVHKPREECSVQVEVTLAIQKPGRHARARGRTDDAAVPELPTRFPRITRLMALAIKFQDLVELGEVRDYADLARLGYVTRARMTQIMNLLMLAPDIQESLLSKISGAALHERDLRRVVNLILWRDQRNLFKQITGPTTTKATIEAAP